MENILDTIKTSLGIAIDEDAFDVDILMHINTAIMNLTQLGVCTDQTFKVTGREPWSELITTSTKNIEGVKTYIYLKVRLMFDPPSSSFVIDAMNRQALEIESRLNIQAEST